MKVKTISFTQPGIPERFRKPVKEHTSETETETEYENERMYEGEDVHSSVHQSVSSAIAQRNGNEVPGDDCRRSC
jgi:hypothetical protein